MMNMALGVAPLISGSAATLDAPSAGCLSYRGYTYRIPNRYRGGSLGEVSGTDTYIGDHRSTAEEASRLLLADPATSADEKTAERERGVSRVFEGIGGSLIGIDLAAVNGVHAGWTKTDTILTATSAGVGILSWGIGYAVGKSAKKHAERARRIFNDEAAATGQCPPAQ